MIYISCQLSRSTVYTVTPRKQLIALFESIFERALDLAHLELASLSSIKTLFTLATVFVYPLFRRHLGCAERAFASGGCIRDRNERERQENWRMREIQRKAREVTMWSRLQDIQAVEVTRFDFALAQLRVNPAKVKSLPVSKHHPCRLRHSSLSFLRSASSSLLYKRENHSLLSQLRMKIFVQ